MEEEKRRNLISIPNLWVAASFKGEIYKTLKDYGGYYLPSSVQTDCVSIHDWMTGIKNLTI